MNPATKSDMEGVISQDCVVIITNYCGNDTVGVIKININFKKKSQQLFSSSFSRTPVCLSAVALRAPLSSF